MKLNIESQWHGRVSYSKGLLLQENALNQVKSSSYIDLIGLEHDPVITLGIRSHNDDLNHYVHDGFEVVKIKRGGHVTIHNPGQLVIYPILPLREMGLGVKDYVCLLIKTTKDFFKAYDVKVEEKGEPGLFSERGKVALFGIHVSQGISLHGLSINIKNDLKGFKQIPVCGVQNEKLDKLSNYTDDLDLEKLFFQWVEIFKTKL